MEIIGRVLCSKKLHFDPLIFITIFLFEKVIECQVSVTFRQKCLIFSQFKTKKETVLAHCTLQCKSCS